jgi:multicomponent Na+:H+ antiporter subunit E
VLLGNVMLAIIWTALSGFSFGNLALGFVVGYVILAVLAFGGVVPRTYHDKTAAVLSLVLFLIREFLMANVRMAADVVRPVRDLRPGIVAVPLDVETDLEILVLTTLISLTPGTLAVDLSDARDVLYVHVMHVTSADEARASIKEEFERRVIRVLA